MPATESLERRIDRLERQTVSLTDRVGLLDETVARLDRHPPELTALLLSLATFLDGYLTAEGHARRPPMIV